MPGLTCGIDESIGPHHGGGRLLAAQPTDEGGFGDLDRPRAQFGPGLCSARWCAGVQNGPLSAEQVVEANQVAGVVGDPRLRDLPTDCGVAPSGEEAVLVSSVG